jgi:hypothetical protein
MAKAKDLAALAGLAGLAYAMRGDKDNTTAAAYPSGVMGGATQEPSLESPEQTIKRSMKKAPLDGTEMYPSGVMGGARQPKSVRTASSTPAADNTTVAAMPSGVMGGTRQADVDPRNLEAGMSRGTRPVDPRNLEAGMSRGTRYKQPTLMKNGGTAKKMASGGMTASRRADGIATKGKTRGKIC